MRKAANPSRISKLSTAGVLISLGIVFGDIGTSPLYVMNAIIGSSNNIREELIIGALSCIIWTLTLQTTIKYVIITLRADNRGEGGIFSLFALIRRRFKWAYVLAIAGGATLLADGIITPSITVVSAVEGLKLINPSVPVIPIALGILMTLFFVQHLGTSNIGKAFGPIMVIWFLFLGVTGMFQLISNPIVLKAFNPFYAVKLIVTAPEALLILGAVFLATTGAEALYSDLGHCGLKNIRAAWIFVKTMLILNYLGQSAWILKQAPSIQELQNPFFGMLPLWLVGPAIILATSAAIIASQALISGSFTLVSEAMQLNLWPKMKRLYPSQIKGQVYIPVINWFLFFSSSSVILIFRESTAMEAAYGLSITITMLMTTLLMTYYLRLKHVPTPFIVVFALMFLSIEVTFLYANLLKFFNGGWITIAIASALFLLMYGWYNARQLRNRFMVFVKFKDYMEPLRKMSQDKDIPKYATNLVYITHTDMDDEIERKIIFSLFNKRPKRADVYWFLHVDIIDTPYTFEYNVVPLIDGIAFKINFRLGFKVEPRINLYFNQVVEDMQRSNEIDQLSKYKSLRPFNIAADYQFIIIERIPNADHAKTFHDKMVLSIYNFAKLIATTDVRNFNLDTSLVVTEQVPLGLEKPISQKLKRV